MFEGALQPIHVLIVVVVALLLFGAQRLPRLGRSLGSGIREFKTGLSELHTDIEDEPPAVAVIESPALAVTTPAAEAGTVPANIDQPAPATHTTA